jgi:hypothetical protein
VALSAPAIFLLAVLPFTALLSASAAHAATANVNGFPFTGEDLTYSINWPSGLSLGDAHMRAQRQGENWNFELSIDASIPGFDVRDHYSSVATSDLCSLSFDRTSTHGSRKTHETETISNGHVVRQTADGGGKSEFGAQACVKDALTFLYFTRRELGQGRVPQPQDILFGHLYSARLDYVGAPVIRVGGKPEQSDQLTCTMTGPNSTLKFAMYFARDAARTPLLITATLSMGTFQMELVR